MTFIKETLTFKNSPMDNFTVYDGENRLESDYKAVERAMRHEAVKYVGRKAIGAVAARMQVIDSLLESIRI